ncbi:MAG: hypothetical protein GY869_30330, partial [Planctomycetes bacterium]|nr:hypothetical protein [Planctomycetota bacterium]
APITLNNALSELETSATGSAGTIGAVSVTVSLTTGLLDVNEDYTLGEFYPNFDTYVDIAGGKTLNIGSGFTVPATYTLTLLGSSGTFTTAGAMTNNGTIILADGGKLNFAAGCTNTDTIFGFGPATHDISGNISGGGSVMLVATTLSLSADLNITGSAFTAPDALEIT